MKFKLDSKLECTKLQDLVKYKNLNDIKLHIKYININEQDIYGRTLLHYCALFAQLDIAKYLIEKNADVKIKDRFGNTAFDICVNFVENYRFFNLAKLLAANGATVIFDDSFKRKNLTQFINIKKELELIETESDLNKRESDLNREKMNLIKDQLKFAEKKIDFVRLFYNIGISDNEKSKLTETFVNRIAANTTARYNYL